MEINLYPDYVEWINKKVEAGLYDSFDDVVNDCIGAIYTEETKKIPQEEIDKLNAEIEKGYNDMLNGKFRPAAEVFEELKKKYS